MEYKCPYCNWIGVMPNSAEYEDTPEGEAAYERDVNYFNYRQDHHRCE